MKKIVIAFLILISQSVFADTQSDSDKLFNWAETQYPEFFSPPNQTSQVFENYYYRYYPNTNNYLGTDISNLDIYVLGDSFDGLARVDTLNSLLQSAGLSASSLSVTGSNSDVLNQHTFTPNSFEYLENGDMKWVGNGEDELWYLIIGIVPGSSPKQAYSVTFGNGWTVEQIADFSNLYSPVAGVTINDNSITFTSVGNSSRLTLNGTLLLQ